MLSFLENPHSYYIVGGALATCITLLAARHYLKRRAERKAAEKRKGYPANTVILHQLPRAPYVPSFSPFAMKLETYLHMQNIPYQNEFAIALGPKDKFPWITYNGEDLPDSEFIMEFLNKEFHKNPNSHLNAEQRAIARSMRQMVEESLFWIGVMRAWVFNNDNFKLMRIVAPHVPTFIWKGAQKKNAGYAYGQGYGRHTREEIESIERGDLQALSDFLGEKAFLMGDQPCQEDCVVFGMLAQFKWHIPDSNFAATYPNLSEYCERMKDRFWPDWDECITDGGTREATK